MVPLLTAFQIRCSTDPEHHRYLDHLCLGRLSCSEVSVTEAQHETGIDVMISFVFAFFCIPETKGMSIEE